MELWLELWVSGAGFSLMNQSRDYRKFADECYRLAADAQTERQRKMLREMAEAWEELADADEHSGLS
jgi:hypothetical protein